MPRVKCPCGKIYQVAEGARAAKIACKGCGRTLTWKAGSRPMAPASPPPRPAPSKPRWMLPAAVGGGAIVLLAILYFAFFRGGGGTPTPPAPGPVVTPTPAPTPGPTPAPTPSPGPVAPPNAEATLVLRVDFDPADPKRAAFVPGWEVVRPAAAEPVVVGGYDRVPDTGGLPGGALIWHVEVEGAAAPARFYLPVRFIPTNQPGMQQPARVDVMLSRFGWQTPLKVPLNPRGPATARLVYEGMTPGTLESLQAAVAACDAAVPGRADAAAIVERLAAEGGPAAEMRVAFTYEEAAAMDAPEDVRRLLEETARLASQGGPVFDVGGRALGNPPLNPAPTGVTPAEGAPASEEGPLREVLLRVDRRRAEGLAYRDVFQYLGERQLQGRPVDEAGGNASDYGWDTATRRFFPLASSHEVVEAARKVLVLDAGSQFVSVSRFAAENEMADLVRLLLTQEEVDARIGGVLGENAVDQTRLIAWLQGGATQRFFGESNAITFDNWAGLASDLFSPAGTGRYRLSWAAGALEGGPAPGEIELVRLTLERPSGLVDTGWRLLRLSW